ncbi:cholesterol 25-hydroxylase-like protein isoform 3-T3 [Spinachia spinachia]
MTVTGCCCFSLCGPFCWDTRPSCSPLSSPSSSRSQPTSPAAPPSCCWTCCPPVTVMHWYLRPLHLPQEAPPLGRVLAQVLVCLLLFDFQSFVWHLLHHRVPWLYRSFHKVHHTFSSTSSLTTEHSGAWETLSLGFLAAVTPVVLGCHPLTELFFFLLNIWLSVEDHCGYDLPCSTHRLVPLGLYGEARHHDLHHLKSNCNYAPYFTHWDLLAGTLRTQKDGAADGGQMEQFGDLWTCGSF